MNDGRDDAWYETITNSKGETERRLIMNAPKDSKPGEFTTYDTSHGHCGLCGSLSCCGGCFK